MATIAALRFTKDWTDPSDFPTTEPDEAQARADMQFLFNEIRNYINEKLLPAMPSDVTQADLNMRGFRVTEVGTPTAEADAANKAYVDEKVTSARSTATITTSWSGTSAPYTQRLNISGVTADSIVEVALRSTATAAQAAAYAALQLQDGGQGSGYITLRCFGTKNTTSIPINVIVRRD